MGNLLFDPASHEPPTERVWDEGRARVGVAAIAADVEEAFDAETLWPGHELDEDGPQPQFTTLYLGAAGVVWALHALERAGAADLARNWGAVAAGLHARYLARPDFAELVDGPVPSLWMGEAGLLLVAHTLAPAPWQEERLLEVVRTNEANPTRELMWGAPGTMLAAQVMHERTGDPRWLEAWRSSADRLWDEWDGVLWQQDLYGRSTRYLGPAHGFAGAVFALARGAALDPARRVELEQRTVETLSAYVVSDGDLAQWPPLPPEDVTGAPQPIRTQWCHGAPGIVASLAGLAPGNDELTSLLLAGGELTWRAGPLRKGAGLCHGTGGNGYAFLELFERTGDQLWLERARVFAMHALEQVERERVLHGQGRYTLWTGDPGAALYVQSCLDASSGIPTLDVF